jgi:hypothetical protein
MNSKFETNAEYSARLNRQGAPNSYYGDYPDYYVFLGRSRDSNNLEESNFVSALKLLGGESEDIVIERAGHWAVGWVEHIAINPANAEKIKIAEDILDRLENYPILDDDDFCQREYEEYSQEFEDYYRYNLGEWKDENEDIPEDIIEKAREIAMELQGYSDGIPWDMVKDRLREDLA